MPAANRPTMVSVAEAEAIIEKTLYLAPIESRPLESAFGAVLREEILADRDFPPYDRVTMDGIAISHTAYAAGRRRFDVAGIQAAGAPPLELRAEGDCIEAMTGAVLPCGCDCVVPKEELDRRGDSVEITGGATAERWQFVHRRGSDYPKGERLLAPGVLLRAPEIGVCAAVGRASVRVSRRPSIALVATGDELVDVESVPEPHQVRTSNVYAVQAALAARGYDAVKRVHVRDEREAVERTLRELLEAFDVLVISGGVSAGRFDLIPDALERLGVAALFHKVRQRPGLPFWFGSAPGGRTVFALPGNPVSTTTCAVRYLIPFLERTQGMAAHPVERARLTEELRFDKRLTLFLPVKIEQEAGGVVEASPRPVHGSGDFVRLSESDGFVELPETRDLFEKGTVWPFYRWGSR